MQVNPIPQSDEAELEDLYRQAYLNGVDREKNMERWVKNVQSLIHRHNIESRIQEVEQALEAYNFFEEHRQEPNQDLKPGNQYLLYRHSILQSELKKLEEKS